jgi:DNA-binding XRE family transcriptional regulator
MPSIHIAHSQDVQYLGRQPAKSRSSGCGRQPDRHGLNLSQQEFAERYDINLRTLQDWEQGRVSPDSTIMAYIRVIAFEPEAVRRALARPPADAAA